MRQKGILYIATGEDFIREATLSAKSVKSAMPDIPIAIATEQTKVDSVFDMRISVKDPNYDFDDQIKYLSKTPFDKTLYLDTDIYINTDVSDLFNLIEEFDIAAAMNHNREAYEVSNVPVSFPEYNTGVVVYKMNSEFNEFIDLWREYYDILKTDEETRNQPAFRKALFDSSIRIATLRPEDNLMVRYSGHSRSEVRVFHGRLLDIDTPGSNISLNMESVTRMLNSPEKNIRESSLDKNHRVWIHEYTLRGRKIKTFSDRRTFPRIVLDTSKRMANDGFLRTIKKIFDRL